MELAASAVAAAGRIASEYRLGPGESEVIALAEPRGTVVLDARLKELVAELRPRRG